MDQAIAEANRTQQLAQLSPETNFTLGSVLVFARQKVGDQVLEGCERSRSAITFLHTTFSADLITRMEGMPEAIAAFKARVGVGKKRMHRIGQILDMDTQSQAIRSKNKKFWNI